MNILISEVLKDYVKTEKPTNSKNSIWFQT
jgi:hypothetical protein